MQQLINYFRASHARMPRVFWWELISTLITVVTSLGLAITAAEPDLRWIYPGYFAGAAISIWTGHQRNSPWTVVLCCYFCIANTLGWTRAMLWW